MDSMRQKNAIGKMLEIVILIGLVSLSIYFMFGCMEKFLKRTTTLEEYSKFGKNELESPTLTICFNPGYKFRITEKYNMTFTYPFIFPDDLEISIKELFHNSTYRIGKDFNITIDAVDIGINPYILYKEGHAKIYSGIVNTRTLNF